MKTRIALTAWALFLFSAVAGIAISGIPQTGTLGESLAPEKPIHTVAPSQPKDQRPENCTVFYAADDQVALGGNNEDCFNPRTKIWFLPPESGKYGVAIVGYEELVPQGAVNDHGLFYDGLAVRFVEVPKEEGKPVYAGNLVFKAMTECATVDCVLELFSRYSRGPGMWNGQLLFGDSTGNSAIIEPLTTIRKEGKYQVATNFFQSEVKPANRDDHRYNAAMDLFKKANRFSVDLFRDILNATHQEGQVHTLYSTVYDLKQGLIYLYFFHDFDRAVIFNLKEELAKGIHSFDIPALFPPSPAALAFGKSIENQVNLRQTALSHVQVKPELLATYAGKYEIAPEEYILVKSEGDRLFARAPSMPWVEVVPQSDTRFAQIVSDCMGQIRQPEITFLQDESGEVARLEFNDGMGNKVVAPKVAQPNPLLNGWWTLAALLLLFAPLLWLGIRKRITRGPESR